MFLLSAFAAMNFERRMGGGNSGKQRQGEVGDGVDPITTLNKLPMPQIRT